MKLRLFIAASLAAATFGATAVAQEQPWLADRRMGEGMGIRTGNFELHPSIAAEGGYDSNYFLRAGNAAEPEVAAWRLRVTPSLTLSTLGTERRGTAAGAAPSLNLRASLWAAYNELIAADSQYSDEVSDHRHVDLGVSAHADILPQRPLGADVYGDFVRTGEPSNSLTDVVTFDRGSARGGVGASWRPGGGLFEWRLGYELRYNYFEDGGFGVYDNFQHSILTRGRWRFLPRTALLYDAQYSMLRYTGSTPQNNGDFVQTRVGLRGLVTNRFAFLALMGWNSSYFEDNGLHLAQNYDGFVAQGELKWFLQPSPTADSATVGLSSVAAGYVRSFSTSYLGSFYVSDRGYGNLSYFLGGMFLLSLEAGLSHNSHPESYYNAAGTGGDGVNPAFSENRIDGRLFGEYRFSEIFAVNTTWIYEQRLSDAQLEVATGDMANPLGIDDIEYSRWQAWVGLRAFW